MNTSAGDNFLFRETVQEQPDTTIFTKKSVYPLPDTNAGNYSGFVIFDGQSVTSLGNWQDLPDITIDIPYMVSAVVSNVGVASANTINASSLTLKNGLDIIDGIEIQAGGQTLTTLYPYSNMLFDFKKVTETSADENTKYGNAEFFAKNTGTSCVYQSASNDGVGLCNNRFYPIANTYQTTKLNLPKTVNEGLIERAGMMYDGVIGMNGMTSLTSAVCGQISKSVFRSPTSGTFVWEFLISLKLKSMSNLFQKIGLTKGMPFRIQINYNSCAFTLTTNITAAATAWNTGEVRVSATTPYAQTSGRTNPILVSSFAAGNPNALIVNGASAVAGTIAITSNVYKVGSIAPTLQIGGCVCNIPTYELKPKIEQDLLTLRTKNFRYHDFYANQLIGQLSNDAGSACNFFVTNSLPNMKYLVVIPQWTADAVVSGSANSGTALINPFDTAPSTTAPFAALTNIQVFVGNQGLFSTQIRYDSNVYMQEMSKINAVNGGRDDITTGLLSYLDWDCAYRYYAFDLSRVTDDGQPKSLVFNAQNVSGKALDLYCFIVYERQATVDLVTGQITSLKF